MDMPIAMADDEKILEAHFRRPPRRDPGPGLIVQIRITLGKTQGLVGHVNTEPGAQGMQRPEFGRYLSCRPSGEGAADDTGMRARHPRSDRLRREGSRPNRARPGL